jgi:hypothetical protein
VACTGFIRDRTAREALASVSCAIITVAVLDCCDITLRYPFSIYQPCRTVDPPLLPDPEPLQPRPRFIRLILVRRLQASELPQPNVVSDGKSAVVQA